MKIKRVQYNNETLDLYQMEFPIKEIGMDYIIKNNLRFLGVINADNHDQFFVKYYCLQSAKNWLKSNKKEITNASNKQIRAATYS